MRLHCEIPFSILPKIDIDRYVFFMIKAYFDFIDPIENLSGISVEYSIDLKGTSLDPQYITNVEEIKL